MIIPGEQEQNYLPDANLNGFQLQIIILCALVALSDGFDTQAIAFAAPVIAQDWNLDVTRFGPVFAAGLVGGLVGAVAIGRLADLIGRKPAVLLALGIMGVGSILAPFASDLFWLSASRVMAGFGLGGALPCAIALTTEYAPARLRNSVTTAMFCAFPLGAVVGALVSGPLLQAGNWRSLFWIGGFAPIALMPLIWVWLPESLSWLRRDGRAADISRIGAKLGMSASDVEAFLAQRQGQEQRHVGLLAVVKEGRAGMTARLGLAFLVSLLLVYLLVNWVPALTVGSGGSAKTGALSSALLNLSGIAGGLLIAWAGDRVGGPRAVAAAYILAAAMCAPFSFLNPSVPAVLWLCLTAGLLCVGSQMSLVSVAAAAYPLDLRGSALGLLMACGRIGAVIGPLIGGTLIKGERGFAHLAWTVAAGSVIAAVAIATMPRRK